MGVGHKVVEKDWRVEEHDEDHTNHNKPDDAWTNNLSKRGFPKNMGKFAMDVTSCASLYLRLTPHFLKPVFGPLVTIPNNRHWRNTTKYTLPIINERLANIKRKKEDPSFHWDESNDYISWHTNPAMAEGRHDELTADRISRRLMPLNFAAIHTTALTMTNTLFDLLSSPSTPEWLESIREEAERVLAEEGGQWTKAGLARCHRSDSAIRESMRISNFMTRNVLRKVMPEEGIENKAEGWRAPKGNLIGVDMHSAQHDPEIYPDPDTYDAFRLSKTREEADASNVHGGLNEGKSTGLTNTSDIFLAFSHGRHACPGRFLVSLEMKLLLAYMLMNFEVQPLENRPLNVWYGSTSIPSAKATVKVRRKADTGKMRNADACNDEVIRTRKPNPKPHSISTLVVKSCCYLLALSYLLYSHGFPINLSISNDIRKSLEIFPLSHML